MRTRTSIVLAVIAIGLGLFIYFYEQNLPSTDELQERRDRVLPGFDRDRVDRLVLGEGDDRIELERPLEEQADAGPRGAVGQWKIVHPLTVDADVEAMDSLLSAIDWLERRRAFEEEGAAKAAKFGLAEPRGRVELRLRGQEITLSLGGKAPGKALYLAMSNEANKVFVIDEEFLEQITKEPGDLREKRLASVRVRDTKAIRVTGLFHALRGDDEQWSLETPIKMRAEGRRVDDVVRDLERLRAKRFVADDVAEDGLTRYGLDRPAREVSLRISGEEEPVVLRFGDRCEGHGDEIYATAMGSGTVGCVSREILEELDINVDTLRDLRPTALDDDDVQSLSIARGETTIELRRSGSNWRFVEGDDDSEGDGDGREADRETVEGFIGALGEARADDVTTELANLGLDGDEPTGADVVVRLVRRVNEDDDEDGDDDDEEASEPTEEILRFALEDSAVFLRRGTEAVALALPGSFSDHLLVDQVRFRERRLLREESTDARDLEVTLGSERQVLQKRGARWHLTAPIAYEADEVTIRGIVSSVAGLQAERFVAAAPTAEHELTRPRIRVRVTFQASGDTDEADAGTPDGGTGETRVRTVLIGAETEGGWFARLDGDDQVVFVVSDTFVNQLEGPLVDRDLFAVDEDRVTRLVIERPERERIELTRDGASWRSGGAEAAEGAVDTLLQRLAVARAAEVLGYGSPAASTGLRTPRARLILGIASEEEGGSSEEWIVLIGAEYGDEDSRLVSMRREGVDATFGVPTRVVGPVLEWGASPERDAGVE